MEMWAELIWVKEACIRCQVMAVTTKTEVTIILPWFEHLTCSLGNTRTSFVTLTGDDTMLSWDQLIVRAY